MQHEKQALKPLRPKFYDIPISYSVNIVPEMQEYERTENLRSKFHMCVHKFARIHLIFQSTLHKNGWGVKICTYRFYRSDGGWPQQMPPLIKSGTYLMSGPAVALSGRLHSHLLLGYDMILTF